MVRLCSCLFVVFLAAHGAGLRISYEPVPDVPIVGAVEKEKTIPEQRVMEACEILGSGPVQQVLRQDQSEPGADGWVTIKSEGFEGQFPNQWTLYGDPTWDDETYRPHGGSKSGYCVGSSVSPPGPYPPEARAWMVYGPFSLSDAIDAKLDFYRWLHTEASYDYLFWGASINGSNFYGYMTSGDQRTWHAQNFDLKDVPELGNLCGQAEVWIGLLFDSDESNQYEGAYLDEIVLQKNTSGGSGPDLTYYKPSGWDFPIVPSNVTGTHTVPSPLQPGTNYIDWAGCNQGDAATTDTFFIYLYLDNAPVAGWYCPPPLEPGYHYYVDDYEMTISSGNHTLMTFQDSTNRIHESNENNNRYSHQWHWGGGGGGDYEHVTITSSSFVSSFAPLGSYIETNLGLNDTIVAVANIYSSFPGRDNPEKIRNFIKHAYSNWSTTHVLLGGDVEVVPCRRAYGYVNGQTEYIPCDLYYSDLDGTWDGNGNNIFGEAGDGVDMYPDVYVGRVTASQSSSVDRFVSKFTNYSSNSSAPYLSNVLLGGFDLDGQTYGETTMDFYDDNYIPPAMKPCHKVYDSHGGNHKTNTLRYQNSGPHVWIHEDHGQTNLLGVGSINHGWHLGLSDMNGLSNTNKYTVLVTMACLVGAFDASDCVVEYFMNASNGGGVASMANSRYGWYNPGHNPQRTLSALFMERIVSEMFSLPGHGSLKDFALGKATLVAEASSDMAYRWCMYTCNLLGEPVMNVWIPGQGAVSEPGHGTSVRQVNLTARSHFRSSVGLSFNLPYDSRTTVTVYDKTGRRTRTLADALLRAGKHHLHWDGKADDGFAVGSGVYYVRLEAADSRACCKLVKIGKE